MADVRNRTGNDRRRAQSRAARRDFAAGEDMARENGYERANDFPIREHEVENPFTGSEQQEAEDKALRDVRENNGNRSEGNAAEGREAEPGLSPEGGPAGDRMSGIRRMPIGKAEIETARSVFEKYRTERSALTDRIKQNQAYYEFINTGKLRSDIAIKFNKTYSAYLFNSVANKHADFMDNIPSPAILPTEPGDEETAEILSDVIPCILDKNDFEYEYSHECYDKIITGTGVFGCFWDPRAAGGLGEVKIRCCDIMNIFWQSGVEDIQDSPNLFYTKLEDNEKLKIMYPDLNEHFAGDAFYETRYDHEDQMDTTNKSLVIDWYYKKTVRYRNSAGEWSSKQVLHYCKFCNGVVLYSSENEGMEDGYYDHGLYPFVFDVMFPLKGSPAGFGYVDVMKNPQEYIDAIDAVISENARINGNPRYWMPAGSGVNERDFKDQKKKLVKYSGDINGIKPIEAPDLPSIVLETKNQKIEELKETSGNRDFSQGSTTSGVTAASAIAALQEAGSKLSRDMIKLSYNSYAKVCRFTIEYIRQFYDIERVYRVTGAGSSFTFRSISGAMLGEGSSDEFGELIAGRRIDFDIKVSAQKASPFSRLSQNELAKELYSAGVFNPQFADQAVMMLEMMDFEGKDDILQKVNNNARLYQENMQLKQYVTQLSSILAGMSGNPQIAQQAQAIAQKYGISTGTGESVIPASSGMGSAPQVNSLGAEESANRRVDNAKAAARERSSVR